MDAFWHRDLSPSGFYDVGPHIVVVPNLFPRPSVVIDHESTHVSIINCSTLGLMQQMTGCLAMTGWELRCPRLSKKAAEFSDVIMRHVVEVHEATAWFGTELTTVGLERIRAPSPYRRGLGHLLSAFVEMGHRTPDDEEFTFGNVMSVADGIAAAALSPPIMSKFLRALTEASPQALDDALRKPEDAPMARFAAFCAQVGAADLKAAQIWAEWTTRLGDGKEPPPELPRAKRSFWTKARATPDISMRPNWRSPQVVALLHALGDGEFDIRSATDAWQNYNIFNTYNPAIDRYSQCCLTARPKRLRPVPLDGARGEEYLLNQKWITVSVSEESEGFAASRPNREGHVVIRAGDDEAEYSASMTVTAQDAAAFLKRFSKTGGGIVATGTGYDFGAGDFVGHRLLKDLPHAVMALSDFRSLWTRLAFMSQNGLNGEHDLQFVFIPSQEHPEEFGYFLLRGKRAGHPVIVMPMITRQLRRALSVTEFLGSPYGTRMENSTDRSFDDFTGSCARPVYAAMMGFSSSLVQPDLPEEGAKAKGGPVEYGLSLREQLKRMASR